MFSEPFQSVLLEWASFQVRVILEATFFFFLSFRRFEMLVVTLPVFLHLITSLSAYSSQLAAAQTGKEQQKALADVSPLKSWTQRSRDTKAGL